MSDCQKIKDFISTVHTFTTSSVKRVLPDVSASTIKSCLSGMKANEDIKLIVGSNQYLNYYINEEYWKPHRDKAFNTFMFSLTPPHNSGSIKGTYLGE